MTRDRTDNSDMELLWGARLALLQSLCQTRAGASHVIQNNLFRAVELSGLFAADPDLDLQGPGNPSAHPRTLERHYFLLVRVARLIGAAVLARGAQSNTALIPARRFLADHRTLVVQVLKKTAGVASPVGLGAGSAVQKIEEHVEDLAEAFMVLISATGFLEVSLILCHAAMA